MVRVTPRRPLLLTGGPAAGKSSTALRLADTTSRCAFVDVDDVRQLVKNAGAAPWDGEEGIAQQMLGARNAAVLAANFVAAGFNVVLADVVTARTLTVYRDLLPDVLVVRLEITLDAARERATQRPVHLTDAEFAMLHDQQHEPLDVDHVVDVSGMSFTDQVAEVGRLWRSDDVA